MQQLVNELKQARGEIKRIRIDLNKLKSEERHRIGKIERIIEHGTISLVEKNEIESGNFGNSENSRNSGNPPEKKKMKISKEEILEEKIKYSKIVANQIGIIKSDFLTKCGTPHQPGRLKTTSTVELTQGDTGSESGRIKQRWMPKDVLDGLEQYSHCWLLFHFHLNDPSSNGKKSKVAPPRAGGAKVGIFASRAPYRPSPIGLSLVKIEKIDKNKGIIIIDNCDLVNETPILDIKPYIPEYDAPNKEENIETAAWLETAQSGKTISNVGFTERATRQIRELWGEKMENVEIDESEFKVRLSSLIRNDPRSIHRKQSRESDGKNSIFFVNFMNLTITVWFDGDYAEVLKVVPYYEHRK
jgi:tRNA-Thr(GGU) m(6)t(6)A37 methyltransferase TsaA